MVGMGLGSLPILQSSSSFFLFIFFIFFYSCLELEFYLFFAIIW